MGKKSIWHDQNVGLAILGALAVIAIVALVLLLKSAITGDAYAGPGAYGSFNPGAAERAPLIYVKRPYAPKSTLYYERAWGDAALKGAENEQVIGTYNTGYKGTRPVPGGNQYLR